MNTAFAELHRGEGLDIGQSDLIPLLSLLVECLQTEGNRGGADNHLHQDAAQRALAAALGVEKQMMALSDQVSRLQKLAVTDELTGLLNRRGFESELKRTLAMARRHDETGMLMYVDLNDFKIINDTFGHAAGDEVLRHVGAQLMSNIRSTDIVGRLGGDEFGIILTRAASSGGYRRAQSLERMLNDSELVFDSQTIRISACFGALPYGPGDEGNDLLARADAKMYRGKKRNLPHVEHRKIA